MKYVSGFIWKLGINFAVYQVDWRNLMKQSVTAGAQLLWGGRYGCNNGRYGCTIVMSYIEINKAVSQWLLTFNLCVSVTWPLTCAFHIPCTHTPEIIDMHRGVCDKTVIPAIVSTRASGSPLSWSARRPDRGCVTKVSEYALGTAVGQTLWGCGKHHNITHIA